MNIFRSMGCCILTFLENVGQFITFCFRSVVHIFRPKFYGGLFVKHCINIGFYSLPVIGMTTLFAGMVISLQISEGLNPMLSSITVPQIIVLAITKELSPVLTGLMIAGRIGASTAAEVATMRVTEQIDALKVLSTDPYKYLVVPRLLAAFFMVPFLVFVGDIIGVLGGYIIGVFKLNIDPAAYMLHSIDAVDAIGVVSGLIKAATFGCIIILVGCYEGFRCSHGAMGVGRATTNAIVVSSILILVANYTITELFVGV